MKFLMDFAKACYLSRQCSRLCSILLSFISLWVKIGHRTIRMFQSSPVQCSRSNLTTCLRKGCLLRFQLNSTSTSELIRRLSSNSTATSDCGAQTISGMVFNLSLRSIALLNLSIIHYLYSPSQPHWGDHACFGATSTHADLPHLIRGGGRGGSGLKS